LEGRFLDPFLIISLLLPAGEDSNGGISIVPNSAGIDLSIK
jgi:hypothetical protein